MDTLLKIKTSLSEDMPLRSAWYRYGFLAVVLVLVANGLRVDLFDAPNSQKHEVVFTPLLLLFNHLAFSFRWSRSTTFYLRAFALLGLLFVVVYTFAK